MTQVGRLEAPVISRVVLLADDSAKYVIAGLSQLDRIFRTLEECFAPVLAQGGGPDMSVVWTSHELLEVRPTRLRASHQVLGEVPPAGPGGNTLVLRTNVIFRRGMLARLLRAPGGHPSFAILNTGDTAVTRGELEQTLHAAQTDDAVWVLQSAADALPVERQLLRTTVKPTDGLVSRTLNRPISQLLSRFLVHTRVTPNQISFLVLGVLALSTWTLTRGTPQGFVLGMLLFHLASILDGCDGEIARAKFLESRLGALLDTSVDLLGNFVLALAVGVGLSRQTGLPPYLRDDYLLEGMLTAAGIAIGLLGVARSQPVGRTDFSDFGSSAITRFKLPRWLETLVLGAVQLMRKDSYAFGFVLLAVLGRPEWILHTLAIGVALHFPVIAWSWWMNARMAARLRATNRP